MPRIRSNTRSETHLVTDARFAVRHAGEAARMRTRTLTITVLALCALAAAGCGGSGDKGGSNGGESKVLVGAGSTLVAPLVSQWSNDYAKKHGVTITYGAIGSGGGISQITARTVDFGASDAPFTPDQAKECNGCLQIPWALAATLV